MLSSLRRGRRREAALRRVRIASSGTRPWNQTQKSRMVLFSSPMGRVRVGLAIWVGVAAHAFDHHHTVRNTRLSVGSPSRTPLGLVGGAGRSRGRTRAMAEGEEALNFDNTRLYPQTPLVAEGMLKVSELHTVAWFEYGNPEGKPVLFVHGGPGGGTAPMNSRYFDPEKYRIILVDQRGCGKSTPFAELEENTTWDLVSDFEQIREMLGIDTWMVFGGSWGSTLSLSYAISHPDRVTELVLRGIFLLRKKELDFFYEGMGTNFLFPEQWEDYKAAIPEEEQAGGFIKAFGRRLRGELGDEEKFAASKAWSIWEGSVSRLVMIHNFHLLLIYKYTLWPYLYNRLMW